MYNSPWFQGLLTAVAIGVIDALYQYTWSWPIDWKSVFSLSVVSAIAAIRLYLKTSPKDKMKIEDARLSGKYNVPEI